MDDIKRMTPEEWRELQDEIQRDYARRFIGLSDVAAKMRQFQRDAQAAKNRQALPIPFVGGMPTVGPTLQFEMSSPGATGSGLPLGVSRRPAVPGALPVEGTGGPFGVSRPTIPGALPVSGASLPLGPQVGTPDAGFGTGRAQPTPVGPPEAGNASAGGAFDPRLAALILASVSDAVKENLTLQGARGAKGTATPNLLAVQRLEQEDARDQMKYRLEASKWLAEQPERRLKLLTDFANLAVKVGDLASTADPEKQKIIQSGMEQQAEALDLPKSWVGDYLAMSQAERESIRDLLPHLNNPMGQAALQLIMLQGRSLVKEGKFRDEVQKTANFEIERKANDRLPKVLSALDTEVAYKGKDKPRDVVVGRIAEDDPAMRDWLMGVTSPKDKFEAFNKRMEGMGVAMPERAAEIAGAVAKQKALLPGEVEKAEALEEVRRKYAGTAPLTPEQIGAIRDDYMKASTNFIAARDAFARHQDLLADPARRDTSAADITRLYTFIKMQAPDAVREGEVALARGTSGVVDQAVNLYNRLLQGQVTLTPRQRENLDREIPGIFRSLLKSQLAFEADLRKTAEKHNADPDEAVPPSVIGRFRDAGKRSAEEKKATAPPKGATIDQGRAELDRLVDLGLTREQAIEAMRKAGWK